MNKLSQYEVACVGIAELFRATYYSPLDEIYYVADDVTGVFELFRDLLVAWSFNQETVNNYFKEINQ